MHFLVFILSCSLILLPCNTFALSEDPQERTLQDIRELINHEKPSFCGPYEDNDLVEKIVKILSPPETLLTVTTKRVKKAITFPEDTDGRKWIKRLLLQHDHKKFFAAPLPFTSTKMADALNYFIEMKNYSETIEKELSKIDTELVEIQKSEEKFSDSIRKEISELIKFFVHSNAIYDQRVLGKFNTHDVLTYHGKWEERKKSLEKFDKDLVSLQMRHLEIEAKAEKELHFVVTRYANWKDFFFVVLTHLQFPRNDDNNKIEDGGCDNDSYITKSMEMSKVLELLKSTAETSEKYTDELQQLEMTFISEWVQFLPRSINQRCSCIYKIVENMMSIHTKLTDLSSRMVQKRNEEVKKMNPVREKFQNIKMEQVSLHVNLKTGKVMEAKTEL